MVFGSTTDELVRRADVSVLVAPHVTDRQTWS
jgi:nucleotide-binding universal stress UspA family protein